MFKKINPEILAMLILWGFKTVEKSVKSFNKQVRNGFVPVDSELWQKTKNMKKHSLKDMGLINIILISNNFSDLALNNKWHKYLN